MAHSNTVQFHGAPLLSLKPLFAIKDFILLLVDAFIEAKQMEAQSHKNRVGD